MYSRSASVASIPHLRDLRDTNDEEKQSHRRSWSLGPFGRKSKPSSRPNSIFLLRRNTERARGQDQDDYKEDSRPHSWLGSGIDVSRAQAWSSRRLPQTTYVDPTYAHNAAPGFSEPPTTPPPNSNGVIDSHLGVLPSPAPTSIHNPSLTDLRRNFEEEPPLPEGAQDRILRSVMRHASPPVDATQLQAVQGIDPEMMDATGEGQPASMLDEEDPDRTLTGTHEEYDEFEKDIDNDTDDDDSLLGSGSDSLGDDIEVGTGVQARVIKNEGEISPVGTRAPTREQRRESVVSPISDSGKHEERDELLAQRQEEREQIARQNSYGMEKEMNVQEKEVDSSSDEEDSSPHIENSTGDAASHPSLDTSSPTHYRELHPEEAAYDPNDTSRRDDSLLHDGSSATAVDEDEDDDEDDDEDPPAPKRFSFEDEHDHADVETANNVNGDHPETNPEHVQRTGRIATPPTHIQIPNTIAETQRLNKSGLASDDDSSATDTCSLPGDIVLTPTVQASQNPTPIFDRPPQFEDQNTRKPSPLSLTQEKTPPPPPAPAPNGPPMITRREVRRDSPMSGYDAVPGARLPQEPRRQGTLLQALSNAVVHGSANASPKKPRTEGYAVRVVAAPEQPIHPMQRVQERPPPPPPKDSPTPTKPLNHKPKPVKTSNIKGLDVTIPSPSIMFRYDHKDDLARPSTPPRAPQRGEPSSVPRSIATPGQNDETLVDDEVKAPSSMQRHKSEVEAAMVPLALHPAIRDSMNPQDLMKSQQTSTWSQGEKSQPTVTSTEAVDNDSVGSPTSDDDLYGDHGGVVPPPSNQVPKGQIHNNIPLITTSEKLQVASQPSYAPSQSSVASPGKTAGRHKSKDSLGVHDLASWTNRTSKDDRTWRNSIDSVDSRPMSFVTLPRDTEGKPVERVSTITRKEREDREDLVAREVDRNQEPKSLKADDQDQRSSFGSLAVHQQMGPQQNDFRQVQEPVREEDIPIQRQPTQRNQSLENGYRAPNSIHPPIAEEPVQHDPIEPDIMYQPGPPKTSPKSGKPRHTPIVPIDPSQEHIAYQLSGYREQTKKALELKLQADPNFKKDGEGSSASMQPGTRIEPKGSSKPGVSFMDHGNADRFKLKGKAIGVFKVLSRPSGVQEITPVASNSEPRPSNVSAGSSSSVVHAHRMSFQTQSTPPENGKKKNRFSALQFLKRENNSPYGAPNSLKVFRAEPKSKAPTSNDSSAYQNVRHAPPHQTPADRPYNSASTSGRTSRQSDKYGEGNLLREDLDDEEEEEEEIQDDVAAGHRNNSFVRSNTTLGPIHENQPQPAISPIDTFPSHHHGRTPSPMDNGFNASEPKYDDVPLPAEYDRSFRHINDSTGLRAPNSFGSPSPLSPLSADSPTWRRDPRDPFRGPSVGPPRKFSSDSYAAHVKADAPRNIKPPPALSPVVSPLSSPPAQKKLFGRGIVGAAIGAAKFGEGKHSKVSRNSKDGGQQERPWAITLPNGSEEEEEQHRLQAQAQARGTKVSQILGAPEGQSQGGPLMHPQASGPPPGFKFAQAPEPPPGFRFAAPHEQPPQHPAQHPQHPIHQAQRPAQALQPPQHPFPQEQPHQHSYQQQSTPQVPQNPILEQNGQVPIPKHPLKQPSTQASRLSHQPPPLPGYREVLPREVQHTLSPIPQSASTEQPSRGPSVKTFSPSPHQQHSPPPPQDPILPSMREKQTPLSSPTPVLPLSDIINDLDGPSFLADATPGNSAHPSRESGTFPNVVPGKDGIPDVPSIPRIDASTEHEQANRASSDAPQVNANPRDSSDAPQVLANPRDSSDAPQPLSAHERTSSDVALPGSPTARSSPVNPVAASLDPPPPPGELEGHHSKGLDAPEGIAELSAVPRGEEEDEPVMFAASYPGMEWMPSWED